MAISRPPSFPGTEDFPIAARAWTPAPASAELNMSSIASAARTAAILPGWGTLPPEYAIPAEAPTLAQAQEYCCRLARSHYENFSVATWFLPQRLRQEFFNVYAYCRISDDLGDEVGDPNASLQLLDHGEHA